MSAKKSKSGDNGHRRQPQGTPRLLHRGQLRGWPCAGRLGSQKPACRSAQITEAYVQLQKGEAWLIGAHFSPLNDRVTHIKADPTRSASCCCSAMSSIGWSAPSNARAMRWCRWTCTGTKGAPNSRSAWPRARSSTTNGPTERTGTGSARKRES